MKHKWFFNPGFLILFCLALFSCGNHNKKNGFGNGLFEPYTDSVLKVTAVNGTEWKGNVSIKPFAIIQSMKLIVEFNLADIKPEYYSFDTKKYSNVDLHYSLQFIDENLLSEFIEFKNTKKSGTLYNNMNDSSGVFSETRSLTDRAMVKILVPIYFGKKFKAGKNVQVKIKIWQNYFISDKIYDETPEKSQKMGDVRDTLKMKLIDNVYTVSFKMPAVLKTEIICDSFALQNNEKWSPGGSDNTLFQSSYPDLFYSVEDFSYFAQSGSHVEKSTGKFVIADTVVLYRYKQHEPFNLGIYDYDFLSKNDLLGDTLLDPELIQNNKTVKLKFGHVDRFYFRKKDYGKIN